MKRPADFAYRAETEGVRVMVRPSFLDDRSIPEEHRYVWAYRIRIENHGGKRLTLRHRHWRIVDAQGKVEEVDGPGVVGEQPVLDPGAVFEYASGVPLGTTSGFMSGHYEMTDDQGARLKVEIPVFSLDSPYQRGALQ